MCALVSALSQPDLTYVQAAMLRARVNVGGLLTYQLLCWQAMGITPVLCTLEYI